jgi:hypothetical protein
MKVQKIVSLDIKTMEISQKMSNFSKWVRVGLHNHHHGIDPTMELIEKTRLMVQWAKVSNLLATAAIEHSKELDPDFDGTVEELLGKVVIEARKQKSLGEFE